MSTLWNLISDVILYIFSLGILHLFSYNRKAVQDWNIQKLKEAYQKFFASVA